MDVGEWLKGIGLGQYEATFRAHDTELDFLPDVTEADLEKIRGFFRRSPTFQLRCPRSTSVARTPRQSPTTSLL